MEALQLVRPTEAYGAQVMELREELLRHGEGFDGCAGLESVNSFAEWMDFEQRLKAKYGAGYVPSEVFLAVRQADDRVVGVIDYRHPLTDFLFRFGGNIGYMIRPSERRKGYGRQMLRLTLEQCAQLGAQKVLITCDKQNIASQRVIQQNGGVLEGEVADTVGLSESGVILRYWIAL